MLKIIKFQRSLLLIIILVLISIADKSEATTFIVHPKEDVYTDFQHQHDNFNSRPYLLVSDYEDGLACSYIKFQHIPRPEHQRFKKAEWHFDILTSTGESPTQWRIGPAAHNWDEETVTWAHPPSLLPDTTHTLNFVSIDITPGWKTLDISPLVKGWINNEIDPEKGMDICSARTGSGSLATISNESHPYYLTVEYEESVGEGGGEELIEPADSDEEESSSESGASSDPLQLVFPAAGDVISDTTPTFKWKIKDGHYDIGKMVLVVRDKNNHKVIEREVETDATNYTASEKLASGKYKWYIKIYWNDELVFKTPKTEFTIKNDVINDEINDGDNDNVDNNQNNLEQNISNNREESGGKDYQKEKATSVNHSVSGNQNKKKNYWWWLVLAIIVITIFNVVIWFFEKKKKQNVKKTSSENEK